MDKNDIDKLISRFENGEDLGDIYPEWYLIIYFDKLIKVLERLINNDVPDDIKYALGVD